MFLTRNQFSMDKNRVIIIWHISCTFCRSLIMLNCPHSTGRLYARQYRREVTNVRRQIKRRPCIFYFCVRQSVPRAYVFIDSRDIIRGQTDRQAGRQTGLEELIDAFLQLFSRKLWKWHILVYIYYANGSKIGSLRYLQSFLHETRKDLVNACGKKNVFITTVEENWKLFYVELVFWGPWGFSR